MIFIISVITKYTKQKLNITKPRYSEQILPVPWPFILSRIHCTSHSQSKGGTFILRYSQFTNVVSGLAFGIKPWIKSTQGRGDAVPH